MAIQTIAFLYPGAMGASLARVLHRTQPTLQLLTSLETRSAETKKRAQEVGLEDVPLSELVSRADLVLSILPPSSAITLAREIAETKSISSAPLSTSASNTTAGSSSWAESAPGKARKRLIYIDANAISPKSVSEVSRILTPHGVVFIDGCVIGLPAKEDLSFVPKIYLSSARENEGVMEEVATVLSGLRSGSDHSVDTGAEATSEPEETEGSGTRSLPKNVRGLTVKTMRGAGEGGASALKMCFGGINKGLVGLATTMILSAQAHSPGTAHALLSELAESKPALLRSLSSALPDMVPKAYRWVGEMEEITSFISSSLPSASQGANGQPTASSQTTTQTSPHPADTFAGLAQVFQRIADDLKAVPSTSTGRTDLQIKTNPGSGAGTGQEVKSLLEWAEEGTAEVARRAQ